MIGSILEGKITVIKPFGVFINFEYEGKQESGLVHISEASHTYIANIEEEFSVGDTVKFKVLGKDEKGRINLSIKQATDKPEGGGFTPRPAYVKKDAEPDDPFEAMMKKFKQQTEEKQHDLKKKNNKKGNGRK